MLTKDYEVEWWNKIIATDLSGVFFGMKYEIPAMLRGGGGAIVNMSSASGVMAVAGLGPYTAAKHGIAGLTNAAALVIRSPQRSRRDGLCAKTR